MSVEDWLLENAGYPIKYNLLQLSRGSGGGGHYEKELIECPEVQYWLKYLQEYNETMFIEKIHGSHDYRYENIMGKLVQLGMNAGIELFDKYASLYLNFLHRHIEQNQDDRLSLGKIYSYYDYELILAAFLAMAGYTNDYAVRHIIRKRVNLLYDFTREKRYDIYVDGSRFAGVKKEWQALLINPDLYYDGNIRIPTAHDYVLLSAVYNVNTDKETKARIDTIVEWLFDGKYSGFPIRYGYFHAPGGQYSTKAVCWKFDLPETADVGSKGYKAQCFLQRAYILSHFDAGKASDWFSNAISYLDVFKNPSGTYLFPKEMLVEKRDGYWIFGAHMGMGEDRKKKPALEIESTYWMERICRNSPRF